MSFQPLNYFSGNGELLLKASLVFCFSFFCLMSIKHFAADRIRKILKRLPWKFPFGDLVFDSILQINNLLLALLSLVWGLSVIDWSPRFERALSVSQTAAFFLVFGVWIAKILNLISSHFAESSKSGNGSHLASLSAASFLLKSFIWVALGVLFLENVGVNISSLVAGLGIGGIAIALAVQSILGDLLASISLMADKPFVVGDVISIFNDTGTVEEIGIKTTKIRSQTGEVLIYPNSDLLKNRIKNFQRMREKRISTLLTLDPETPIEKIKEFPDLVKECVSSSMDLKFVGCFLMKLTNSGPEFELIYLVSTVGLSQQMALQHSVTERVLELMTLREIKIANSTAKILTSKDNRS